MNLAASLLLAASMTLGFAFESHAEETLLRITLQLSASDPIGQNLMNFKKDVEEKTGGAVKVDIYDKGQFYLDYQVPGAVGSGAIEMGVAPLAQYASDVPAAGVFMQPFLFNFDAIVRAAAKPGSEIRTAIDDEIYKKTGTHVLWWQPYGPNVIFAKGSTANPRAIAARQVRVFDDVAAEFITQCGGVPHVISDAKQLDSLDRNIVDSSMTSIASIRDYDLWKKTDTITTIRHSENLFLVVLNDASWKELDPEQQNIVKEAAEKAETEIWNKFKSYEAETYSIAVQRGMTIAQPTPDDIISWRVCSSNILETFISRAGALGAKMFAAYGKLRTDPCCSEPADVAEKR